MSLQLKLYALLASVLAAIASGLYINHLHSRIDKLSEQKAEATADASAHSTYASGSRKLDQEYRTAKEETREALEANREWADQPVPDAVADRLRNRTDTSR